MYALDLHVGTTCIVTRLFISYRREDGQAFSRRLRDDLHKRGCDAWLDDEIGAGQPWTSAIEEAIDSSHAVLVVLSGSYHLSRIARMEIERAFNQKKTLVPLLVTAGATPPLLLQSLQRLDFTNPAAYDARMTELVDAVQRLPAVSPESTDVGIPAAAEWAAVLARATEHSQRFLAGHQGTSQQPGSFVPDLYVRRDGVELGFERFLAGPMAAFVLVGDAGVGKTNVLCHWVHDLLIAGHAVVAYDCGALADTDIEREISRDVALGSADTLPDALARIDGAAGDRKLVVVFDSINEYIGTGQNSPETLLRRINAFVGRLHGGRVRVVVSCSAAAWTHMNRHAPLPLDPNRYFHAEDDERVVRLRAFTSEEFERAYPLYQKSFALFSTLDDLAPELRERLREPALLRMTAEAYRGAQQPLVAENLALGVYRRYFEERIRLPRETWLVDELAAEMLRRGTGVLPIAELARHDRLGPEILSEDGASAFARLLDRGVLQEWQADLRAGTVIKFSHTRVAAYAMALHLLGESQPDIQAIGALVARAGAFPLAWEVALTLLLVSKAYGTITTLAESRDLEQRELACEALVKFQSDYPVETLALLRRLLDGPSEQARRTALKAAYSIGPQARDVFLRAAIDGEPAVRDSVKSTLYLIWRNGSPAVRRKATDTLYVIWRHAPGFTYEVLADLLDQISFKNIGKLPRILEFVIDLSITIYINHCDDDEVIQKTADLYHRLATERLYLNLLNTGMFGPAFEGLVFRAVTRAFSNHILDWMLFGEVIPPELFFNLPKERREPLARIAGALDLQSDLATFKGDLAAMLQADVPIFNGAAAFAVAVHACGQFGRTEPVVRALFDSVDQQGRLWLLVGFCVLLQETPPEWVPLLEELTRRYVADHREAFLASSDKFLGDLDIALLPIGLAYGKQGNAMPLVQGLLGDALAAGDAPMAARIIHALGPTGFYYPEPILEVLQSLSGHLDDDAIEQALLACLATVRTIHFDAVDLFLDRLGASESFRRRIDAASNVELVHRYIHVIGYYNNAVHFTIHYPKMREQLSMGALKLLASASDPQQFVADYTAVAVRMFRDADFQLLEWTRA